MADDESTSEQRNGCRQNNSDSIIKSANGNGKTLLAGLAFLVEDSYSGNLCDRPIQKKFEN